MDRGLEQPDVPHVVRTADYGTANAQHLLDPRWLPIGFPRVAT
jgi:hypothetical protein